MVITIGVIDAKTKEYIKIPYIFADLFNHLMYNGKELLNPDNLREMDTTATAIPYDDEGNAYPVQKYRDVMKQAVVMHDSKVTYLLILAAENQNKIHYAMPVRDMLYDAISYSSQVKEIAQKHRKMHDRSGSGAEFLSGMHKDDKLMPVVTLVVYLGQDFWDGPLNLHSMFSIYDENILKFVPDYKINLLAPISMTEQDINLFKSDFLELAAFIRCGRDKNALKKLVESDDRYRHMNPLTADIANSVTNSKLKLTANEKGEVDMCIAITEMRKESHEEGILVGRREGILEGRREGRREGMLEGRREGMLEGMLEGRREGMLEGRREGTLQTLATLVNLKKLSVQDAASTAGISEEDFERYMASCN